MVTPPIKIMPEIEIEITANTVCNGKTVYIGNELITDKRQADILIKSGKAKIAGVTLEKLEARAERKFEEAEKAEAEVQKAKAKEAKEKADKSVKPKATKTKSDKEKEE